MSAENKYDVPDYARPSTAELMKMGFPDRLPSVSEQLQKHLDNDIKEIKEELDEFCPVCGHNLTK